MKTSLHNQGIREKVRLILGFYFRRRTNTALGAKIQDWLAGDRFAKEKDEILRELWDLCVRTEEPDDYAKASLEQMRKRLGFPTPEPVKKVLYPSRKIVWRVAAAVFLIGAVGTWFFVNDAEQAVKISGPQKNLLVANKLFQTVKTGDGEERKQVVLPDGSEVWLSRNSRITWPTDFLERSVDLEGEAQFSVVKSDGKSFTVQGADLRITVLGTEFRFASRKDSPVSEIRLIRGAVEVRRTGEEVWRMESNDYLTFDRTTDDVQIRQWVQQVVEPEPDPGLNFEGVALEEVTRILSARFGVVFVIDERIPLWMTVTVRFDGQESLDEMLFVIASTSGIFNYTIEGNEIHLIRH